MTSTQPRVSIGLPVYNGANYLASTLDSLLAQTYTDFEVVISDNASTDQTQAICEEYMQRDARIRYVRNETNLGAAANYNQVVDLARGDYFKWNGHDDPLAPEFLERCVAMLDSDEGIVLCYARTGAIDDAGKPRHLHPIAKKHFAPHPQLNSPRPARRFYHAVVGYHPRGAIFGLMRIEVLRETGLIGTYISSDLPLLGELALRGRFYEVPEMLQFRRFHEQQPWMATNDRSARQAWYDPSKAKRRANPQLRLLGKHLNVIAQTPAVSTVDRLWCYTAMVWWSFKHLLMIPVLKFTYRRFKTLARRRRLSQVRTEVGNVAGR